MESRTISSPKDNLNRESAKVIRDLRRFLGMNQEQFAKTLYTTQATVSRWESGDREPEVATWMALWPMSYGSEHESYVWKRSGLSPALVERIVSTLTLAFDRRPPIEVVLQPARGATIPGKLALKKKPDAVAIPLLKDSAAAGSPLLIREAEVERTIVADALDCPHPEHTTCIRVSGKSMYPILDEGYIAAVDSFISDPARLIECMVAARDPDGGVTVKWLRKVGDDYMLIPQHTSPKYPPALISRGPGWKIIGEVIWWIGRPR
jgi:SOS-response transcriptional repressor LexA/DNA-binding XRE family transcriptional regulator